MKTPGIPQNSFQQAAKPPVTQPAQKPVVQSNSPFMVSHGGNAGHSANVQSQHLGQAFSYFSVNPNNVQIGQPTDQAKAQMVVDFIRRMLRGEAVAPSEKMRALNAMYKRLKQYLDGEELDGNDLTEAGFEGFYDILSWYQQQQHQAQLPPPGSTGEPDSL